MRPIFFGSVHNFGKSDDDIICEKVLISNRCIRSLMPNLIKKSWTDSRALIMAPPGYSDLSTALIQEMALATMSM